MARLRLFANLREAAGTADTTVPGATVAEVLANAADRFGTEFARAVPIAKVWVNGEEAAAEASVADGDEVALIPPVSGGATVVQSPVAMEVGLVAAIGAALFIANTLSIQWLAVTIVLAGGVWAFDISDVAARRGLVVSAAPVLAGVTGGALATYRFGVPGAAAATALAALAGMVWAVLVPRQRPIESIGASVALAVIGTFGVSSVILLRLASEDYTTSFLVVATAAVAVTWVSSRFEMASLDPVIVGMLAAVVAGGIAATIWSDDLWPTLAASGGAALALVAGRNVGTLMRAGGFFFVGSVPGSLHYLDGVFAAGGAFWLVLYVLA
ncbi:MAG TPA: MoaD/ThiS family protein [Acidimicrobiia bacterium]|nr:MoaD/ThiS family protein [Acidimicrobiia bacterium]